MKAILNFTKLIILVIAAIYIKACYTEPSEPFEIGVVYGGEVLKSDTLFSQPKLGEVTAIKILQNDSLSTKILIVGTMRASVINEKGDELNYITFELGERNGRFGLGNVQPVFNNDSLIYLNRGGGWSPLSLHDSNGKKIWEYVGSVKAAGNDAALIDLDSDGEDEIIVGTNASGGVFAFEQTGEEIWRVNASNAFSVNVFEENGYSYIIHTDGRKIVIRSGDGKQIRVLDLGFVTFEIIEYNGKQAIVGGKNQHMFFYDFYANKIDSFSLKCWRGDVSYLESHLLGNDKTGSIIANNLRRANSELYLFDQNDSLIYLEYYLGRHPAIAEYSSGTEKRLLLGGSDGVVKVYSRLSN